MGVTEKYNGNNGPEGVGWENNHCISGSLKAIKD